MTTAAYARSSPSSRPGDDAAAAGSPVGDRPSRGNSSHTSLTASLCWVVATLDRRVVECLRAHRDSAPDTELARLRSTVLYVTRIALTPISHVTCCGDSGDGVQKPQDRSVRTD